VSGVMRSYLVMVCVLYSARVCVCELMVSVCVINSLCVWVCVRRVCVSNSVCMLVCVRYSMCVYASVCAL